MNKRLVLVALGAALVFLAASAALMLWLLSKQSRILQLLLAASAVALLAALFVGVSSLVLLLLWNRPWPFLERIAAWAVGFLYPVAQKLCQLGGIGSDSLAQSFIAVNNRLVKLKAEPSEPGKLLLLLPHCLQWSQCPHKLNLDAVGCKRCGRCQLGELLALVENYGVRVAFATGGTLARQAVAQLKPSCVVAVACERDLLSGIMETSPLPVYGILNDRPQGPCHNTQVDLAKIEEALQLFLKGR